MQFRPRPSAASNKNTYIPAGAQQSINQQLQQNVPAHLKKYVGTGAYVPQHAQKALQQHLQKTAPGHLKQYAGAFVEQNIVQPGLKGPAGTPATPVFNRPPTPNPLRRDHSNVPGSQYEVQFNNLFRADQPNSQPAPAPAPAPPPPPTQADNRQTHPHQAYDFILNPAPPPSHFRLPGGGNKAVQAAVIGGGLIVLLILFNLLKGLLSSAPDLAPYVSVAQDQQALIQLATGATSQQQNISVVNKNYAFTAQASLTSAQTDLITYLKKQHQKVSNKTLNQKVSAATDQQLTSAASGGTYNQTFHDITEAKLKNYLNDLNHAYQTSQGKNGRALLKDDYAQAQLLLKQLNAPAT